MSHKSHFWLLVYLLALVFSIALLIRAWSELSAVLFVIALALALLAVLGLLYVILRLALDLRQRALDARAREQQLQIEQEKHEAELQQMETRLDLEQRRAWLEEHLALTRLPADALGNYASLITPDGLLTLPPGNPAFAPARARVRDQTPPLELPAPQTEMAEAIPTLVRYEEIRHQIPPGRALVGVSARGVETKEGGVRACLWIVGSSGSGKSNTLALRVEDLSQLRHRFFGIDPHQFKEDSMTNSVRGYASRFLLPIAQKLEEINAVLDAFLGEFYRRRDEGADRSQPITILVDEVGSLVSDVDRDNEMEVEVARKLKEIARICGQEARGFNMGGIFISQDAAGLAWLRKRALMILAHQVTMWSERLLVCNNDAKIARAMDTWPKGRTLAYGIAFPEGPQVVQQPLFTARPVQPTRDPPMPPLPLKEQRADFAGRDAPHRAFPESRPSGNAPGEAGNGREMAPHAPSLRLIPGGGNVSGQPGAQAQKKLDTAKIGNETRNIIKRMHQQNVPLGKIAEAVGLSGRNYDLFKAVCIELGIRKEEGA